MHFRHSPMKRPSCILHELASVLSEDSHLKAIWLDTQCQEVSFALKNGGDAAHIKMKIHDIVSQHHPDKLPDCVQDPWRVACEQCERGIYQEIPKNVRFVILPGAGIFLERRVLDIAPRFWQWQHFQWLKLQPRQLPHPATPEEYTRWKKMLWSAVICCGATVLGWVLEKSAHGLWLWPLMAYASAFIAGGWYPVQKIWELLQKRILDIHFLMVCVAMGALLIGHYAEGATLLFLFALSNALENLAMARTEQAVSSLFKDTPKVATVIASGNEEKRIPVEDLAMGMQMRVWPGDQFPVDAEIVEGATSVDESNLTGEPEPVDKATGDIVMSGTMNLWGRVDCRVLRPATESALNKIMRLIREAQQRKAPSQRFTDKFGAGYTCGILWLCFMMFCFWKFWIQTTFDQAFYQTMVLLVVASPCALVLSVPSAILAAIAAGARQHILFRGGSAIEKLAEIHRVALDKTGTLTTGHLQVIKLESFPPGDETEIFRMASGLASNSTHPVSCAMVREARERGVRFPVIHEFHAITGSGLQGNMELKKGFSFPVKIGRRIFFEDCAWLGNVPRPEPGVTEVIVEGGKLRGRVLLRDEVRFTSRDLLKKINNLGLRATMLTGDREESARLVATQIGLNDFRYGLRPEQKVECIQRWSHEGEKVAMIGDGVNDAPSLAAAYVGVAMGLRGSDAALEQADIVLMQDRLDNFLLAYDLSCRARRIIRQNIVISLGVIVFLICGALGTSIPLTVGVLGHEGSTVLVVLNSLRLLIPRS